MPPRSWVVRVLAALPVAGLVATSCVGSEPAAETVTLQVVLADDWSNTPAVAAAVQAFEDAHPGVRVNLRGAPFSQLVDTASSAIAAGNPPDVVQWHAFAAGARGIAEPVDDLWGDHLVPGDFLPGALEDVTWAGVRYGVPLDVNSLVLFVNADLAGTAGFDAADLGTFDDIRRLSQAATNDPVRGLAVSASSWITFGWIRANGGNVLEVRDDGTVEWLLTAPETVGALELLGDLVKDKLAHEPYARDFQQDAYALYEAGAAVLHPTGSWDLPLLEQAGNTFRTEVVPMPTGANGAGAGTVLGGSSLWIPKGSQHRELAFELMVALIEDDVALRLAEEEGRLPVRRRVFAAPFFETPEFQVVVAELERASAMQLIAFPKAEAAFSQAIEDVYTGQKSAADALARAQEIAEAETAGGR